MVRLSIANIALFCLTAAVAASSCGHRRGSEKGSAVGNKAKPPARQLPPPLALPKEPIASAHIAAPAQALHAADAYVAASLEPTLLLRRELGHVTSPEWATTLAGAIDAAQPWTAARIGPTHEIATCPYAPTRERILPKAGRFAPRG